MFPTKIQNQLIDQTVRSNRLAKILLAINVLSNIKFARADPNREVVARANSSLLERTQIEHGSLEQMHINLSALIQIAGSSSEVLFARANASKFHSEILQLFSFFNSSFSITLPQPAIDLDLLSTPHLSSNTHNNHLLLLIPSIHNIKLIQTFNGNAQKLQIYGIL